MCFSSGAETGLCELFVGMIKQSFHCSVHSWVQKPLENGGTLFLLLFLALWGHFGGSFATRIDSQNRRQGGMLFDHMTFWQQCERLLSIVSSCWLFSVSNGVIIRYHQRNWYCQVNKRIIHSRSFFQEPRKGSNQGYCATPCTSRTFPFSWRQSFWPGTQPPCASVGHERGRQVYFMCKLS